MSLSNTQPNIERARRAMTFDLTSGQIFVPVTPDVADEFGKNPRTIKRWIEDDRLGFPRPVRINGRLYLDRQALEEWKQARVAASLETAAV
jgi:predicted DNA-binding transcriptional regulator AlpA